MRINDEKMWRYFELLSFRPLDEIDKFQQEVKDGTNPRDIKFKLATEIVARFHSEELAQNAQKEFIARFQKGAMPEEIQEIDFDSGSETEAWIVPICTSTGLTSSNSEAIRMINSGAVKLDGEKVTDKDKKIAPGNTFILQVGKRKFARVTVK